MKRVIILCLAICSMLFTACKSEKDKYLERYERIAVNIIENHSTFTSEEWQMAESSYELLRTEYTQFSLDMTPEERYHVDTQYEDKCYNDQENCFDNSRPSQEWYK